MFSIILKRPQRLTDSSQEILGNAQSNRIPLAYSTSRTYKWNFLAELFLAVAGRAYHLFFSAHVETPLAGCRYADYREAKPWTPSYLVIACLHERLLPERGAARNGACTRPTSRIHGAKIYGIELNGIKTATRSCGEIRTARPPRCAAHVRHLMMLAFAVFDFPSCRRVRNETRRCVTKIFFTRSKPDTDDWYFRNNEKHS